MPMRNMMIQIEREVVEQIDAIARERAYVTEERVTRSDLVRSWIQAGLAASPVPQKISGIHPSR